VIFKDTHHLLTQLEADASLFAPARLRQRIEALDALDAYFGGDADEVPPSTDVEIFEKAANLRRRLEAANAEIYAEIREQIRRGNPESLRSWIELCSKAPEDTVPGLGYDHLDELIAGVLQIPEPGIHAVDLGPEQVFYQPTPVRHALRMIERSGLSADDVLVDFGSGLGQFCLVATILTGARVVGLELESVYVDRARECAADLRLNSVEFLQGDAQSADLSTGTVFHLYTPFTGSILRTVLDRLRQESTKRPITICTLGPCTGVVAQAPWLRADEQPDADLVTVFRS